jgi:membrane-associated phospholipid phosphatase
MSIQCSVTIIFFLGYSTLNAQFKPAVSNEKLHLPVFKYSSNKAGNSSYKSFATPVLLFGAGLYAATDNDIIDRLEIKEERDEYIPTFRHRADNYLQYAPIAIVYGLNAARVAGKTDLANRTAILVKSELFMATLAFTIKKLTAEPRPDTGQPTSFPSGHTAQAFAAATFMAKEYGHRSVWYSIGAYSLASGIGIMRVMNNRHWISDVLAGAGIGILSTNIAYLTHQYRWGKKKRPSTLLLPGYNGNTAMICMIHSF